MARSNSFATGNWKSKDKTIHHDFQQVEGPNGFEPCCLKPEADHHAPTCGCGCAGDPMPKRFFSIYD